MYIPSQEQGEEGDSRVHDQLCQLLQWTKETED